MEINLASPTVRRTLWGALVLCVLLAVMLLGRSVTPVVADRPAVLTPEHWQAAQMTRQARGEIQRLVADSQELRGLAEQETPDPIRAMTLAQRIYAGHRTGTAATAPARQDLIAAAEQVARYSAGGINRAAALAAVNAALARLQVLVAPATEETGPRE